MNSTAGHRENILKKEYTDVGYAVVNGILNGEETTLVVQEFGKPLLANEIAKNVPVVPEVKPMIENKPEQVLAQKTFQPKINVLNFSFNLNVVFMTFLLLALALDFYFASKFNIIRIAGKNTAHFLFIIFILMGLFISTIGTII